MAMKRMWYFSFSKILKFTLFSWTHTGKAYRTYAFALCPDWQIPNPDIQPFAGSSFVDIGLKVVVRHTLVQ